MKPLRKVLTSPTVVQIAAAIVYSVSVLLLTVFLVQYYHIYIWSP